MSFTNFVCWNLGNVRRVMDVEATQPQDHIFLATHHPISMYRKELIKESSQIKYSEEEFLRDFLSDEAFTFVPILGDSGTGKSHLIRWLHANIKSSEKRKVLLIPKIGTNLKDIITLILEGMDGERFDEYRERVNRATNSLTETQARVQLLNQLAASVGDDGKRDRKKLTNYENFLVDELSSLLYDPFFREHWLRDNGIIHRLVVHILGQVNKVESIEERREFTIKDLPSDIKNLTKASEKSREFYASLLGSDEIQKLTVDWLNKHLDEAITQVLNLGREDLQRLMREVRETLAEQEIELVLLIEDFAKLQGIDREVLEAVLARPQQPGRKQLCAIRTALACTTGYFESLIDTVQQRISFSVNLDIGIVSNHSLITQTDIQEFVARYLNAVRLEDKQIIDWMDSSSNEDFQREPIISACSQCQHTQACHAGFGDVNGMGLYPFTSKAIEQMHSRVNLGNFNPRILIKDVLKYVLEMGADDIKKGKFPSVSLCEHFGSRILDNLVEVDIKAKDPLNFDRRATLIKLWTDSDELCNLSVELHDAFNLPAIQNIKQAKIQHFVVPKTQINPTVISSYKEESGNYTVKYNNVVFHTEEYKITDALEDKINALNRWNIQEMLSDAVAKEIRELIFPAIVENIQWNVEMLIRDDFVEVEDRLGKIFKQTNVIFSNPKVKRDKYRGFVLSLPLSPDDKDEFLDTRIAFQGIIQYNYYKSWKFPNSDRYFRTYIRQLEKWSQYVLQAIKRYPRESGDAWNPVPAAVELLAISATMAGHPTSSLENAINSLFLDIKNSDENRTETWKKLSKLFNKYQKNLLDIVKSRIACTKGSSKRFQIIDSVQITETLDKVRKTWQPQCEIPKDISDYFSDISECREQVDELLDKAINEEYQRQLNIYKHLVLELGEDAKKKEIFEAILAAMNAAQDAGIFRGGNFDEIIKVLEQFQYRTSFSKYQDVMKRIQTEKENSNHNTGKILQYLSEDYQKVITDSWEFVRQTSKFLDSSILEANSEIIKLQPPDGETIESSHQLIINGLDSLKSALNQLKEDTKCS